MTLERCDKIFVWRWGRSYGFEKNLSVIPGEHHAFMLARSRFGLTSSERFIPFQFRHEIVLP